MQFVITFIQNKKTGKREQYCGFFYNPANGKYSDKEGYVLCELDSGILFYVLNGRIAIETLEDYEVVTETLGI